MTSAQTVVFRADASFDIGTGHVMRCLTLADLLRLHGFECHFICRELLGNLCDAIELRGFTCHRLQLPATPYSDESTSHSAWLSVSQKQDAAETRAVIDQVRPTWIVVDHYALDRHWEQLAKPVDARLLVIDDLADRAHICEILLDQNMGRDVIDYSQLAPENCATLVGPKYALLRPEFAQHRNASLARRGNGAFRHILVSMGGVDRDNVMRRILESMSRIDLPEGVYITVVLGNNAPWTDDISHYSTQMPVPVSVLTGVNNMAQLMSDADVAVGAAGSTSWERCCLGLPTLIAVLADNQKSAADEMARRGVAILLQNARDGDLTAEMADAFGRMQNDKIRQKISQSSASLVDGNGAGRVVKQMLERVET